MRYLLILISTIVFSACLDPTAPAFQLEESFYLVEGSIGAGEGNGEVRIRESAFREQTKRFDAVEGAIVTSLEAGGAAISWEPVPEEPGIYRLPAGVTIHSGETWHLAADLPDGTRIESDPERVPATVPATAVDIVFEQNGLFDPGLNRFLPRFEIYLSYDDPTGVDNYYSFDFRYWEETIICASCPNGRYRNGECIRDFMVQPRYDYFCDTPECYRITEGGQFRYGDDELTDGRSVTGLLVGEIPFEDYGGLLVEGILRSVTVEGHAYGTVLQDLTSGNAGLNATTPAALDGNVRNLDPSGRTVLGFVGALNTTTVRAFVEKTEATGVPFPFNNRIYPEPPSGFFVPPRAPCDVPGRTSERPDGWGE